MIKLTRTQPPDRNSVVRVEGRLDSETVRELEAFLAAADPRERAALDVSGLASIDHDGRSALIRLQAAGYDIVGASLYINRLLTEVQP